MSRHIVLLEHTTGQDRTPEAVGPFAFEENAVWWRDEWLPAGEIVELQSPEEAAEYLRKRL